MKKLLIITAIIGIILTNIEVYAKDIPLKNGKYTFIHKFAEHPSIESITVDVTIKDTSIIINNNLESDVFPKGIIESGKLIFHTRTKQWIISKNPNDQNASEVGGCSDGPSVIDLEAKIYWTC